MAAVVGHQPLVSFVDFLTEGRVEDLWAQFRESLLRVGLIPDLDLGAEYIVVVARRSNAHLVFRHTELFREDPFSIIDPVANSIDDQAFQLFQRSTEGV